MIDKAKIVLMLCELRWRSDEDVHRQRKSKESLMQFLGSPPTVDAFGHDY